MCTCIDREGYKRMPKPCGEVQFLWDSPRYGSEGIGESLIITLCNQDLWKWMIFFCHTFGKS